MRKAALLAVSMLFLGACQKPPEKEIAAAEAALNEARQGGADRLAADRFGEAQKALEETRRKVEAKDYRGAQASALQTAELAHTAAKAALAAVSMAKGAVEVAQAEIDAKLEEVAVVQQEASDAKAPDAVFAELAPSLDALKQRAAELTGTAAQDAVQAQKAAEELKAQASRLPDQYREALDKWEADHPRRGKPPAKKK